MRDSDGVLRPTHPSPRPIHSCTLGLARLTSREWYLGARYPDTESPIAPHPTVTPLGILRDVFGYEDFRPGQLEVIEAVVEGRDCIALMPTGAGKSLTFQVPARMLDGTVLVVSPLISLMKDQVDALTELGFRAAAINSSLEPAERERRLQALRAGEYELVYLAPEGLDGRLSREAGDWPLSLLVVDEGHRRVREKEQSVRYRRFGQGDHPVPGGFVL